MDRKRRDFLSATAAAVTLSTGLPAALAKGDPPAAQTSTTADGAGGYAAPTEIKAIEFINLRELEPAAQKVIPPGGFGYISSAAGDEWTKRENEAAFKRVTIAPRYLTGYNDADRSTTLLGSKVSMPIILSAMAGHGMAHATAEVGSAKGTGAAGTLYTAASLSTLTMEGIAQASPGPKWFQIYLPSDRGKAREILERAKAAGYRAIVLTIDTVVASNRETDRRNHFRSPLPIGNFPGENGSYAAAPMKRDLDWDDVEFIRKTTGLPVLLKGVMSPELAVAAVERGCAGVQVSNHGGRQLDDVSATISVLPRIAEAVHGRATIIIDGGVRRGQDVFKALALGANAVAIGRPLMYGLALGGWMGVQAVFQHLDGELEMTMRLAGARTIAEISKRYITA
ncbi:MAG: alpha-hydroxy-acid oxidizing protein [Candidatus Acidiferrales bacterium]|jgi:isopentenyl diphosphate isomerase/L-lactate dehydrogenase-like FMN-dependent dehydrogenase